MSKKLFNRHYSACKLRQDMDSLGLTSEFLDYDCIKYIGFDEVIKIFAIGCEHIIYNNPLEYTDIFNPIKPSRLKFQIHIRRKESILFSQALDWPEKPRFGLKKRELDNYL